MTRWLSSPPILLLALTAIVSTAIPPVNSRAQMDPSVADRVIPAVVQIAAIVVAEEGGAREEQVIPRGSGTVVSPTGTILTNHHVIALDDLAARLDAEEASFARAGRDRTLTLQMDRFVVLFSERDEPPVPRFTAAVALDAADLDLATLQIVGGSRGQAVDAASLNLPFVPLGDSDAVRIADQVHLFGYPTIGSGMLTYTRGAVSGFDFEAGIEGRAWINADATISGGSSGGAAVNDAGELIGIPTLAGSLDCRHGDTNGDGVVDEADAGCIPVGGALARLRPINLARPLLPAEDSGRPTATAIDELRVEVDGVEWDYGVADWTTRPELVMTGNGGAWAFFSAWDRLGEFLTPTRLVAASYDPATGWSVARAMPGGNLQYGPSAVVDASERVHLVFLNRATDDAEATLVYTRFDPLAGIWTAPEPVAPHPAAGDQSAASLALGEDGRLHVVWVDQRDVDLETRESPFRDDAHVYASDLIDGVWTEPVRLDPIEDGFFADRPLIVAGGGRLVALWTIERWTDDNGEAAAGFAWSSRPGSEAGRWSPAASLVAESESIDGASDRDLVAVAAAADGRVIAVHGVRSADGVALLYRTDLAPDASGWSAPRLVTAGNHGADPDLAVGPDGSISLVYDVGRFPDLDVELMTAPPGSTFDGQARNLTRDQTGRQQTAVVAVDRQGRPWVLFFHWETGVNDSEARARIMRGVPIGATPGG